MATRSMIGIVNEDKTVSAIYCHFDGYPNHNGKVLTKHYNSQDKAEELIKLGDIRFLENTLQACETYNTPATVYENEEDYFENASPNYGAKYAYLFENGKWEWKQV
jgi:hypothetical protein